MLKSGSYKKNTFFKNLVYLNGPVYLFKSTKLSLSQSLHVQWKIQNKMGTAILTFYCYTAFSKSHWSATLDRLMPWLTSVSRSVNPRMRRAHTHLSHFIHPASMGNRTVFLVNNSNAKRICQKQRTCPKGRKTFDLLIWSTFAVLFLNTVWNRKETPNVTHYGI